MNTHDHDNDALPGEEELKSLYRSLPRKEPSPALDTSIQRAAADAVRADQRRRVTRWPVAVASAAVMVVAVGLGWRMMQQPASMSPRPATSAVVVSAAPASEPSPAAANQGGAAIVNAPAAPLAAAPAPRIAMPAAAKRENIRSAMKAKVVAPAIATEQPPASATESAPLVAMNEDRMAAPAPAAPAPIAQAASIAYAPQAAMRATAIAGASEERATTAMRVMAAPAAAPDSTAANAADTPAQELEKIRQLLALHRRDEAAQRLTMFRQTHPDVPVPDDLRAQLPDHE